MPVSSNNPDNDMDTDKVDSNESPCELTSDSDTEDEIDDDICVIKTIPAKLSTTPSSKTPQKIQQFFNTPQNNNKKSPFGMGKVTLSSAHKKGLSLTPDSKKMSPKTPALKRVSNEIDRCERVPDGIIGMRVRTPPSIAKDRRPSSQS